MSVADKIRQERERQGITQADLAIACKAPVSAISHYECGRREPRIKNLVLIAKFLNVSLDWLCEGKP